MAGKNLQHLFIDGCRVTFDRRDHSVTIFPDENYSLGRAHLIGWAEGSGRLWTATAPDGTKHRVDGRKAAAEWLIKATEEDRRRAESDRAEAQQRDEKAVKEAVAILNTLTGDVRIPQPARVFDSGPMFLLDPEQMRDLLVALTDDLAPRRLPLALALDRVVEHQVVLFTLGGPYDDPEPMTWGWLDKVASEPSDPERPDLGDYAEFYFDRDGGDGEMLGVPGLSDTALVSCDAVVIDEEDGLLIAVIADDRETLDVPASNALEWDRAAILALVDTPPPKLYADDEDDAPEGSPESQAPA